ncbi:MAG: glycine oxidase ThiO [Acidobacteria bacterium]|nr:glycine oxidase ThiO [Acidobacteriota bacterium]MBV9481361.1 glycine oxidase ThiO [Acidobacteriota bacterium]
MKNWDVIVIGAGIIGLSLARELRKRSAAVLVLDRGMPGREASHAAAGMLAASPGELPPPLLPLASVSFQLYPEFVHELEIETGMNVDFRNNGALLLTRSPHRGVEPLRPSELCELEPNVVDRGLTGVFLHEASVDPRALVSALLQACKHRGVDTSFGDGVNAVNLTDARVVGVRTEKTTFAAPIVINCAGAWAGQVLPCSFPTRPVKGQMLSLAMPTRDLIRHVIRAPEVYLVPRSDGRLLVGATIEEVGYDKRVDAATIQRMHHAALTLVPALERARLLEDWAGLRPATPDSLPILGPSRIPGYFVATGHFRDGILLTPISALAMAQIISGEPCAYRLEPFSPARFD